MGARFANFTPNQQERSNVKYKIIFPVLALVFVAAACNRNNPSANEITNPTPSPSPTSVKPEAIELTSLEIVVSDTSVTPKDSKVKKGSVVTFVNKGTKTHWIASDPHPTHTDYSGFDPQRGIAPGQSWSFTFDKVGLWKFHDHLQPTLRGSIIVE